MRANHREHNIHVQQLARRNIGDFWKHINNRRIDIFYPSEIFLDDQSADEGNEIADLFSRYFKSPYQPSIY